MPLAALDSAIRRLFGNAAVWEYGADRGAVASGGIAEAVAGKSIQSLEGTEGCLTRPGGKAVVNSCEIRVGAKRTLCRALGPAKENNYAAEPPKGYIVPGCWGLKRKFPVTYQRCVIGVTYNAFPPLEDASF